MYCPSCEEMVPEWWDRYDETFCCPECRSLTYETKEEYIEVLHGTARWERGHEHELQAPKDVLFDAIDEHYDDERCGAPIGDVVQTMLAEPNFDIAEVGLVLRNQYFDGAIYQPSETTIGRVSTDGGRSEAEIDTGDGPDADEITRLTVDDWADAKVIMSGTSDVVEGDGLTQRFDSLQPGEDAVAEVIVDGETVVRILGGETA